MITSEIRRVEDIAPSFKALKGRADALYVCPDALVTTNSIRINILAVGARLPTTYVFREDVAAGGLMSYGPSFPDVYRRAADFVDKVLREAKPADLPVEQPTKFDLVINLVAAQALGLEIGVTFLVKTLTAEAGGLMSYGESLPNMYHRHSHHLHRVWLDC